MIANDVTADRDIRYALHRKCARIKRLHPETLVIDELGLAHAKSRIDVAVINGCIHGYEIKSDKDSLYRFERQFQIYRQTLQKLTIVVAPRHLQAILAEAPHWCGIVEASVGIRGGVKLNTIRMARLNPDVDPIMMAHLLWRSEVVELLSRLGYTTKELRLPRKQLYELLSKALSTRDICHAVRGFMIKRKAWRGHLLHE